jgi:hypothetical protein
MGNLLVFSFLTNFSAGESDGSSTLAGTSGAALSGEAFGFLARGFFTLGVASSTEAAAGALILSFLIVVGWKVSLQPNKIL